MSKLLLLYLTFVITLVFMLIPNNDINVAFPFSNPAMSVSLEYYIYSIFERSVLIILAYIIANEAQEYREVIWVFFWLMVVDFLEYLLTYSSVWFTLGGFPISFNVVKCVVFGVAILYAWTKNFLK